eukprot:360443-Chlamydomonas_euryale.AAC.6
MSGPGSWEGAMSGRIAFAASGDREGTVRCRCVCGGGGGDGRMDGRGRRRCRMLLRTHARPARRLPQALPCGYARRNAMAVAAGNAPESACPDVCPSPCQCERAGRLARRPQTHA